MAYIKLTEKFLKHHKEIIESGLPLSVLCRYLGVAERTVWQWRQTAQQAIVKPVKERSAREKFSDGVS